MHNAFGVPYNNVLVTGEPRNDYLFNSQESNIIKKLGISRDKKIIIWMPTYRQNLVSKANDGEEYELGIPLVNSKNIIKLNSICREKGVQLVIKWHSLQQSHTTDQFQLDSIKFITSEDIAKTKEPLYSLVANSEALITDYSSIYVNYLVLNRPICFAYDDIELYKHERGFMFDDVEKIMPGYHTNKIEGVIEFIRQISDGIDEYSSKRVAVNGVLNKYSDGNNAKRLIDALRLNAPK
jgi:CDP-glycerol glycerophosphotransferase (TagB/SpsB family)